MAEGQKSQRTGPALLFLFSRAVLNTLPVCRHAALDLGMQDAKRLRGGKFAWCEKTEVTPLRWSPEALRPAGGASSNSATAVTPGALSSGCCARLAPWLCAARPAAAAAAAGATLALDISLFTSHPCTGPFLVRHFWKPAGTLRGVSLTAQPSLWENQPSHERTGTSPTIKPAGARHAAVEDHH